ncbi:signal transduction histidine kinase [Chitinivorax tropicus]|uniref:histidine kinase n=1 Tax=Chitinivorax tropicus TaxID=714531 RepID=A0A840MD42_9PROT|nr:ATP-binding protein [Chitinivorax tropicus]MBB5017224.1 signal transduction histidine kinase [Chitinivorax tropicus]
MQQDDFDSNAKAIPNYAELSICWMYHSVDPERVGHSLTAMQVEAMPLSRRALLTVYLASCCFELGEVDAAINYLGASRQWNPLRLGARIDWLRRFCEAQLLVCRQDEQAISMLEALSRFPANQLEKLDLVFCHDWLARARYQQGDLRGALRDSYIALDHAQQIQAEASQGDIACRLGMWFAEHGLPLEASRYLQAGLTQLSAISAGRNLCNYRIALIDTYLATRQPTQAMAVLTEQHWPATQEDRYAISRATGWLQAAEAYLQHHDPATADHWLEQAMSIRAASPAFLQRRDIIRAELLLAQGETKRSLQVLQRWRTQPGSVASAHFHELLARTLIKLGDWEHACMQQNLQLQAVTAQHQLSQQMLQADLHAHADWAEIRQEQALVTVRGMVSLEHEREWHRFLARLSRLHIGSEFSAGVIHELKQPLAAMLSYSQAGLRLTQQHAHPDAVAGVLSRIQDTARHATLLVERLRAFLAREPQVGSVFNLNNCVRDVIAWLRPTCEEAGIHIRNWLAGDLPDTWGNPVLVQQVIVNLLRNAHEALADYEAEERIIVVETYCQDQQICCRISDSGPGIDEARLPRLFEPFHTTKAGGMGLGLKISRAVLAEIGGDLRVENSLIGASIVVSIPLAVEPTTPEENEAV